MGAACCHSARFNDPLLSLAASAMSVEMHHFYTPLTATSLSSPSLSSSSPSARHASLANYASFPFPFVVTPAARAATQSVHENTTTQTTDHERTTKKRPPQQKQKGHKTRAAAAPYVGQHWRKTTRGTYVPLTLLELSVRRLCAEFVVHRHTALDASPLPPEVASQVLQWLRQHHLLDKPHFRALAPLLLAQWNLAGLQEVDDSWFDGIPATTLAHVKSIDVSGCTYLRRLGSDTTQAAVQLPELVTASFQGCSSLSRASIDLLTAPTKLTSLNLSGCANVDDESLEKLSALRHLRSLQVSGCRRLTDNGVTHLWTMTALEKLRLGRCERLTDAAMTGVASSLSALRELDVAYCRLSDQAMHHIGRVKSLEVLIIRGCHDVSDDCMAFLADLTRLRYFDARHCHKIHSIPTLWSQLQVLLLGHTSFAESDTAVLQHFTELQELELRKCHILKRGFEYISRLKKLAKLDLGETSLTDAALVEICNGVSSLKALNISNTAVSDNGTFGLARLKKLRTLHLDTQEITNRALADVCFLPQLERLDLFGANITDDGLLYLVQLHELRELTICGGNVSDHGVEVISKLASLTYLNLSQNPNITSKSLSCLRSLTSLQCLNLSNTGISALSLHRLSPLKELQSLSVYGCSLSQRHIDALRDVLPALKCLRCN
ncbi:unnamed protein product [Hyaloperonospora brassicae]|uniref:F-box/LRR-repeat protein 15-like leucin rich repeat domain-containing protein n=1 Tax=Hyaloperonospora brassicae TaxID=162125 RepID=A0AAV0TVW9_HYABA|nr:unnamed protein product [Hyaloperonospora brassicae]